jgi:hypothetical protein
LYLGRAYHLNGVIYVAGVSVTMSYRTLELMVEQFEKREIYECTRLNFKRSSFAEDYATGICLNEIGISPYYTRDKQNRELFMVKSKIKKSIQII